MDVDFAPFTTLVPVTSEQSTPQQDTVPGPTELLFTGRKDTKDKLIEVNVDEDPDISFTIPVRSVFQYVCLTESERRVLAMCRRWIQDLSLTPKVKLMLSVDLHRLCLTTIIDTAIPLPTSQNRHKGKGSKCFAQGILTKEKFMSRIDVYLEHLRSRASRWEDSNLFRRNFEAMQPILRDGCMYWSHLSAVGLPVLVTHLGIVARNREYKPMLRMAFEFCLYYGYYNLCIPGEQEQFEVVLDLTGADMPSFTLSELIEINTLLTMLAPARSHQVIIIVPPPLRALLMPLFQQFLTPLRRFQYQFIRIEECSPVLQRVVSSGHQSKADTWPFPILKSIPSHGRVTSYFEVLGVSWWKLELEGHRLSHPAPDDWMYGPHKLTTSEVEALLTDGILPDYLTRSVSSESFFKENDSVASSEPHLTPVHEEPDSETYTYTLTPKAHTPATHVPHTPETYTPNTPHVQKVIMRGTSSSSSSREAVDEPRILLSHSSLPSEPTTLVRGVSSSTESRSPEPHRFVRIPEGSMTVLTSNTVPPEGVSHSVSPGERVSHAESDDGPSTAAATGVRSDLPTADSDVVFRLAYAKSPITTPSPTRRSCLPDPSTAINSSLKSPFRRRVVIEGDTDLRSGQSSKRPSILSILWCGYCDK
eukprot:Blabericola_migrator_1__1127@NODE_128_length_13299_cov_164_804867_g113_i0_p2_GENE_NODE_128_length_13299_cov_164_804867_g113_i0NODE_128_length_13299_cov_164_804867_g113_i0_p2_ORF_typecomplete_len646_score110_46CRAL_TRIO/PF00650_20/8_8e06_NODE_128_length_13299_cov_164_804867_g113_i0979611733